MTYLIEFQNTNLAYNEYDKTCRIVRLIKPQHNGDPKMPKLVVPIGVYKMIGVVNNLYGRYVTIEYKNEQYDLDPKNFEYHKVDQYQIGEPLPNFETQSESVEITVKLLKETIDALEQCGDSEYPDVISELKELLFEESGED